MRLRHLRVVKYTAVLLAALSMVALVQPQAVAATPSWNHHLDIYYTSVTLGSLSWRHCVAGLRPTF